MALHHFVLRWGEERYKVQTASYGCCLIFMVTGTLSRTGTDTFHPGKPLCVKGEEESLLCVCVHVCGSAVGLSVRPSVAQPLPWHAGFLQHSHCPKVSLQCSYQKYSPVCITALHQQLLPALVYPLPRKFSVAFSSGRSKQFSYCKNHVLCLYRAASHAGGR